MSRARWVVSVGSPDGTQRTWRFAPGEVRVGRDASCAVRLDDPRLSGVHLRLLLGEDTARILDADSRHGARLDTAPLSPNAPVRLDATSVVEFVDHRLTVAPATEGGFTTDSRGTAERLAAVQKGLANVRAALERPAAPTASPPPTSRADQVPAGRPSRVDQVSAEQPSRPPDRLYAFAIRLAVVGGLLAVGAAILALATP